MKGFVYILSNQSMPGLLMIGRSILPVEQRAQELQTPGVAHPFQIEYFLAVENCVILESAVHDHPRLKGSRVQRNRDFFRVSKSAAIEVIEECARHLGLACLNAELDRLEAAAYIKRRHEWWTAQYERDREAGRIVLRTENFYREQIEQEPTHLREEIEKQTREFGLKYLQEFLEKNNVERKI